MELLYQCSGEVTCTGSYFPVDKPLSAEVMIDRTVWSLKTCQVSPI